MTLPTLSGISGNAEQKTILRTTEQQMQCTVLELQFWSFKYMAVIRIRKIWATFHSYSCDTRREQCVDINSPLKQFSNTSNCIVILRKRSRERRNELKLVWDFVSIENLTSLFSQPFTCVHMNWGEMKLKTAWISYRSFWPEWNFKPAWGFHVNIIYSKRNE